MNSIKYFINGQDIKDTCGVCVSASEGIVGLPKVKKRDVVSWDDYHGEVIDKMAHYYEAREITLSCFIRADGQLQFIGQMQRFLRPFQNAGTQRLMIDIGIGKPLVYEVYLKDDTDVSKKWGDIDMIGTFKVKLIEPEPMKRVLQHTVTEGVATTKKCSFTVTTNKLINVYWGDGSADYDIFGSSVEVRHNYDKDGVYYPIITGCIDEIKIFNITNTEATKTVWDRFL